MVLQLKAVREEREAWESELHKIEESKRILAQQEDIMQEGQKTCVQLIKRLDLLSNSNDEKATMEKQAIVRLLVDRVTIDLEGKVTIVLAIPELVDEPNNIDALNTASPRQDGWN